MVDHELIQNGRFEIGDIGAIPNGWTLHSPQPVLTPLFQVTESQGKRALFIRGNGLDDCVGHVSAPIHMEGGSSYRLKVRFRISPHLNPQTHLLFAVYSPMNGADGITKSFNEGIMRFERIGPLEGIGKVVFTFPGTGSHRGEVRIYFRQSAQGSAWIDQISFQKCEPLPPRLVKLACGCGTAGISEWENVLEAAGQKELDLVLLPETLNNRDMALHDPFMSITATLDLAASSSPHNWGGPMLSAPGGRRNRREQHQLLHQQLTHHTQRWWAETSVEISPAVPAEQVTV